MLAPYPRHHLAGQGHQRCCTGTGRLPQHAPHAVSAPTVMAGPYTPHGRWSHSKGCPVWRACHGAPPSRPPRAALQGRPQARPQTDENQHWKLGIGLPRIVEAGVKLCRQESEEDRRRETNRWKRKERGGNRDRIPTQRPHTSATTVAETVIPAAALNIIEYQPRRLPLSLETDGCQLVTDANFKQ